MIYGDNGERGLPDFAAIVQSGNRYAFAMNNPIRFIDSYGTVAYELFATEEECVADWAWNYYGTIYYTIIEQASAMYTVVINNRTYYSYTYAVVGTPHNVDAKAPLEFVPKGGTPVGIIHGHPMGEGVSPEDRGFANDNGLTMYAVYFQKKTGDVNVGRYVPNTIAANSFYLSDVPILKPSAKRMEQLKNNEDLKAIWHRHATTACSHGYNCPDITWPRKWG